MLVKEFSFLKIFLFLIPFLVITEIFAETSIVNASAISSDSSSSSSTSTTARNIKETSTESNLNLDSANLQNEYVAKSPDTTPIFQEGKNEKKEMKSNRPNRGRAMPAFGNFDPMGAWKSASKMVQKGVHAFRDSLQEGMKVASMLKDDVDDGMTQMFGNGKNKNGDKTTEENVSKGHSYNDASDQQSLREGMLGGLLRFMNVDSSFLGVMALNVLIYVAEMITSSILGKDSNSIPETRTIKANLMEWIVKGQNKMLDQLINDATSDTLPEKLLKTLQDKTGNSTSCVQLLFCKLSPVIWGVQKTVTKQLKGTKFEPKISSAKYYASTTTSSESPRSSTTNSDRERGSSGSFTEVISDLMKSIPGKDSFTHFGDECEQRFPTCHLLKIPKKL